MRLTSFLCEAVLAFVCDSTGWLAGWQAATKAFSQIITQRELSCCHHLLMIALTRKHSAFRWDHSSHG